MTRTRRPLPPTTVTGTPLGTSEGPTRSVTWQTLSRGPRLFPLLLTSLSPSPADWACTWGGAPSPGPGTSACPASAPIPAARDIYLGEDTTSKARALGLSDASPQPTSRDEYLGEDTVTRAGSLDVSNFGTQGHEQVGHRLRANIKVLKRNTLPFRPSPWPGPPTSTTSAPSPPA